MVNVYVYVHAYRYTYFLSNINCHSEYRISRVSCLRCGVQKCEIRELVLFHLAYVGLGRLILDLMKCPQDHFPSV